MIQGAVRRAQAGYSRNSRALHRKHGDKSDVWCFLQIVKTDKPQGRSAETIRKRMKK